MATKKEKELREFAKKMLVQMRTDQELLTSKNEVLKDIRSRLDECLKKVNNCGMTNGIYSTTQMAKELGMSSAHKLYEELREAGIAFCQGQEWMLASRYSTYQLTEVTTHIVNGKHIRSLLWTERGRRWLLALKEKNVICSLPKPKTEVKNIRHAANKESGEPKGRDFMLNKPHLRGRKGRGFTSYGRHHDNLHHD